MPSMKHKVLKMTTTATFRSGNPDQSNIKGRFLNIESNRAVLEKMLPQFAGRQLESWVCPYAMQNLY